MLICISGVGAAKRLWIGEPTPELSALGENGLMAVGSGHDSADYGLAIDQGLLVLVQLAPSFPIYPVPHLVYFSSFFIRLYSISCVHPITMYSMVTSGH